MNRPAAVIKSSSSGVPVILRVKPQSATIEQKRGTSLKVVYLYYLNYPIIVAYCLQVDVQI
jgi:hypothetical protein